MTPRAAGHRRPSQAWLGFQLLLVCLLVVGKPTMAKNCKHVIGAGHLKDLQQLIDSQMESSCQISFEFADRDQLKDPVCYLKKAVLSLEDILEENMQFKPNSLNANITQSLQELQLRLMMSCDIKKDKEHSKACVKTFYKTPLQMLVMVKDVFEETKKLLESDADAFVKDCSSSFTQCNQPGHKEQRLGPPDLPGLVFYLLVPSVILVLLAVGGLLFYLQRHRTLRELRAVPIRMEQPEISPLNQEEDRRVELPV
ncbi:macrophage colony-stimulating factor 1 isoform X2 [Ornithorhynchus anatinus]|uniref:macrophage colony-stimulating factor 1 isoform X2 n=1 Tax=Ornithorhynchus anatinus TaxID=9258 RepID=UPI0010A7F090|nr:macrophage colony-stimulating factor 1 isoform X2 [Ornithorhynchus anatinus]